MSDVTPENAMHELDVTVWVGKHGLDAVVDELDDQLDERSLVKVKFLRAARSEGEPADLAVDLAERTNATVLDTRGHTTVLER